MNDITPILNCLVMLVVAVVMTFLLPWIRDNTTADQRENAVAWVKIACAAAEQLYKSGQGELKKQYVLEFLESKRLKVDLEDLERMIEAAVLEINKG